MPQYKAAWRLRKRQNTSPKSRLAGRNNVAIDTEPPECFALLADWPPLSGESVSIVSCTVCVWPDASFTEFEEKWQLTAAGIDRQPIPMVSEKPALDESDTETVPFCDETRLSDPGVTAMLKPAGAPEMVTEAEVDAVCRASPP